MTGKDKGNRFELKMLRMLRKIWPDLHRTIGSGSAKDESGDAISDTCPYMFEFKHHKRLSERQIHTFFDKIEKQTKTINKQNGKNRKPVLIYKENNRPIMVMVEGYTIYFLTDWIEKQIKNYK